MKGFAVFVFNPLGVQDHSLVIAACRAGAIGVINGELGLGIAELRAASRRVAAYGRAPFGAALDAVDEGKADLLIELAGEGLEWLFVPAEAVDSCPAGSLDRLRKAGIRLVFEVTSTDPASREGWATADGCLVKGHESGGRVGEESSLVLLQHWIRAQSAPVYVRGGVGLHNCAGLVVAGAAGAVLDSQLLLLRESPLRDVLAPLLAGMVGTETALIGDPAQGRYLRVLERPGFGAVRKLREEAHHLDAAELVSRLTAYLGWEDKARQLMPIGQDAAFAEPWQHCYSTVGSVIKALRTSAIDHLTLALKYPILDPGSPLANSHGTTLPIVQGPMTRVSDSARFAEVVAKEGGLPMLALALMRGEAVRNLLEDTTRRIEGRPWGVGLLGFAPADLLKTQVEIAREFKPAFAIIAGGRPDQALALERDGVPSYLHVPSPRLLTLFLEQGARRFVFEGRECGGHIGPLASTVLWDTMVGALLDEVKDRSVADQIHVIFAGGIHDRQSAAMVAAVAAPLAARGVKIGILMGTAYLFTREIVETGAVVEGFQKQALACRRTVALETGTGHASRCAETPFAREFLDLRKRLQSEGRTPDEIRDALEDLNLGRLRLASKGVERSGPGGQIEAVPVDRQRDDGMYMIGQVAALRDASLTVAELHAQVTSQAEEALRVEARRFLDAQAADDSPVPAPADIAIVGVGCLLPKARDVNQYWDNILDKVDGITEIPPHRWDWRLYFDPDRDAEDKIYSKWGGFLDNIAFDPTRYGMPPRAVKAVDPLQLMTLTVVRQTLDDAGYGGRDFGRERAAIILGASGGAGDVGCQYAVRAETPRFEGHLDPQVAERLPKWTEDSFAGILLNVAAGRAANRFDFGGANFTVDAACASSLTAVYLGVAELVDGRSDFVIAGGVDTVQGPFGYLCFSKTQALSPRGRCSTFDAGADGIVISEGIAMVALKRLADAERDGDRIYAVIKGVGASSDGRARSMTAPHPDGQIRALKRAYRTAGYSPVTVGLFEAHGTGTVAGDTAELETVTRLLHESGAGPRSSAIGSVKTLIGHTKACAGIAGLIKSTLALHHQVLPPHANVVKPNPRLADATSPLFLVRDALPWVESDRPRRAGVSAFGFGGTNFHVALEEYRGDFLADARGAVRQRLPAELLVWRGDDRNALALAVAGLADALDQGASPRLRDLSYTLAQTLPAEGLTAALVVDDEDDLVARLRAFAKHLADPAAHLPSGAWFSAEPLARRGKVAVLFAGQGTQYPNMMRELAVLFPEFKIFLARADSLLAERLEESSGEGTRLSRLIYPEGLFSTEQERGAAGALRRTDVAQPAIGVIEAALWRLLQRFGFAADMAGGHSYGEYVALYAAGALSFDDLVMLSEARGRFILDASIGRDLGTMAAIQGERAEVEAIAAHHKDLTVANHNAPLQTILSGSREAITAVMKELEAAGIQARQLAVGAAFHSPFVARARDMLAAYLNDVAFAAPAFSVYSNTTAKAHEGDSDQLRRALADHLVSPVEFVREVEAMYADGARLFVGLGPKNVPESLIDQILAGRPHRVVRVDDHEGGLKGLLGALGALLCDGVPLDLAPLFEGRDCRRLRLDDLVEATRPPVHPPHVWILNGSGGHPARDPAPQPLTLEAVQARAPERAEPQPTPAVSNSLAQTFDSGVREELMIKDQASTPAERDGAETFQTNLYLDGGNRDSVLGIFQDTMRQFLQTQESVMLAYLTGAGPDRAGARPRRTLVAQQPARLTRSAPPVAAPQPIRAAPTVIAPAASAAQAPAAPPVRVPAAPTVADARPTAAAPAPEAEPTSAAKSAVTRSGKGPLGRVQFTDILLKLVEDRTGYPPEMLALDQNMEADLGIDSIKRVEIVGALLKALPSELTSGLDDAQGGLNAKRTLGAMIDWLVEQTAGATEGAHGPFEQTGVEVTTEGRAPLPRFTVEAQPEPAEGAPRDPLGPGAYLLVGSPGALADEVTAALEAAGCRVLRLSAADCLDDGLLDEHLAQARTAEGGLRGVVHLAAVDVSPLPLGAGLEAWRRAAALPHLSLLRVLQRAAGDLADGGMVLAATDLGGGFGRGSNAAAVTGLRPVGGSVGLLKSLRQEWPGVHCKAVDLDPSRDPCRNASCLIDELRLAGGRIEVGYPGGRRTIFRTVPTPLPASPGTEQPMAPGSVILATGGARGITAEILQAFAAPGVRLVLVGRTPLPGPESPDTASAQTPETLRQQLLTRIRASGRPARPVDVEREARAILRDREMRANIFDLEAAGALVDYRVADVRDASSVAALLDDLYADHGRIDGVLNAAGLIEDRRLEEKTAESWDRVFGTKVDSTFLLARHLRPESLRFLILFTSVAGRYGNSGQIDYAAANEVLNRLAWQLRALWQDRVLVKAVNWGPWRAPTHGSGMVSAETQRKFESRGVELVAPESGRRYCLDEVRLGAGEQVEVVAGGGPWDAHEDEVGAWRQLRPPAEADRGAVYPLVWGTTRCEGPGGAVVLGRRLDPQVDRFLTEHLLDGIPVMPAAGVLELFAESAASVWPEWQVTEVRDLRVLKGIRLEGAQMPLEIVLRGSSHADADRFEVSAELRPALGKPQAAYRATVVLSNRPPLPEPFGDLPRPGRSAVTPREAYRDWLFHGPGFQLMPRFHGIDAGSAVADVTPCNPVQWLPTVKAAHGWIFDPGMIDTAPQMALIWSRIHRGTSALPNRIDRVCRFGSEPLGPCRMVFQLLPNLGAHQVKADVAFVDDRGLLCLLIEGLECTASPALVRLGGGWKGEVCV